MVAMLTLAPLTPGYGAMAMHVFPLVGQLWAMDSKKGNTINFLYAAWKLITLVMFACTMHKE